MSQVGWFQQTCIFGRTGVSRRLVPTNCCNSRFIPTNNLYVNKFYGFSPIVVST